MSAQSKQVVVVGDPNPIVDVCITDVETGKHVLAQLGDDPEKLVVRVSWSPAGERALIAP